MEGIKATVGAVDIVIDDGGHLREQQQTTMEEMLPNLRPGGVYLCEDVHGSFNQFAGYATGLIHELNSGAFASGSVSQGVPTGFQAQIHSIHFYPFIVVIEKRNDPLARFSSLRQGTEWRPSGAEG